MDQVHARIFCRKMDHGNQFILKDVSNHDYPETSGVWVQLQETETDILQYDLIDREFSVLNGMYMFKFEKVKNIYIQEFDVWMRRANLFWAISVF